MKKILLTVALLISLNTFAQAPQGINYQATIRNSSGDLMVNQSTNIKFTVHQGEPTGTAVYQEQHITTTDNLGAVKLIFGQGTPQSGIFSQINWSLGNYHLEIEVNTGAGFTSLGTTQLMSVPYALYAERAGRSFSIHINALGETYEYTNAEDEIVSERYLQVRYEMNPDEDETYLRVGVVIGLDENVNIINNVYEYGFGDDDIPGRHVSFSNDFGYRLENGFQTNTTYYIRGYAKKDDNTYVYGKIKQVTVTP